MSIPRLPGRCAAPFAGLLLLCCGVLAAAPSDRVLRLQNSVLAPCCWTEPVSRHQSEIAMKMRIEIARLVEEGRGDGEILAVYVARYGSKVLVDPNTLPREWSYLVPSLVVLAAALGAAAIVWRWRTAARVSVPVAAAAGPLPDLPPGEE